MWDLAYALGRVLLSVIFIVSGYKKFVGIAGTTTYLTSLGVPAPEIMAYVVAAIELIGGLLILIGYQTRWAALALCVFTGIALYLGHKFWTLPPGRDYNNQLNHALKNIAIMGGFLLLAGAGPGRLSVDGRRA